MVIGNNLPGHRGHDNADADLSITVTLDSHDPLDLLVLS